MSGAELNLTALIRAVIDESDEVAPEAIAKLVLDRVKANQRADALRQALPALVRSEFLRGSPGFSPTSTPARQGTVEDHGTRAGGGPTSSKVAAIREHWRAVLRQRIAVGDGEYRMLSDCTALDLEAAAERRRQHATQTLARATQLDALAALVREHGVSTVGELPDTALRPAVTSDAA